MSTLAEHVEVCGVRVRVCQSGHGHPLLLIAGIGSNLDVWEPLLPRLQGRRLIRFDVPGTGSSGLLPVPPLMINYAAFTRRLVHHLGYGAVDVLGHSWGGMLAQHLAIQHPHTVRKLVLIGTAPGLGGRPPHPRVLGWMLTPRRYYSPRYLRRIAAELYGGRYRDDETVLRDDMSRRMGRPPTLTGYLAQLMAVAGYSTMPALSRIQAPTLVLAGDDDPIIPIVNARLLGALIHDCQLAIVAEGGHMLPFENPSLVGDLINQFLDRPPTPVSAHP